MFSGAVVGAVLACCGAFPRIRTITSNRINRIATEPPIKAIIKVFCEGCCVVSIGISIRNCVTYFQTVGNNFVSDLLYLDHSQYGERCNNQLHLSLYNLKVLHL